MLRTFLLLIVIGSLGFDLSLLAQPSTAPPKAAVAETEPAAAMDTKAALMEAVKILLAQQERYEPDRPVGRIPDNGLEAWQKTERERLEALRKKALGTAFEWPYEGVYRVGRDGLIPAGYRVGGSAIVAEALLLIPGYAEDSARKDAVSRCTDHLIELLQKDPTLSIDEAKRGYDVRGWGHAYALQFFVEGLAREAFRDEKQKSRVRAMIPWLLKALAVNETRAKKSGAGGWNYAQDGVASSFMTASTLLTLHRARLAGHEVDPKLIERGLEALEATRAETGSYAYAGRREEPMASSSARSAAAELALYLHERSDAKKLKIAVDGFFDHWDELLKRKSQQGTHLPPYGIAPYYFYFGHTYAAMAIEALPDAERAPARARLLDLLWKTREADGSWNDRIFPRSAAYGTAMAALALLSPEVYRFPVRGLKVRGD